MHHQTDTLHDSDYFNIFPTCVGMFRLNNYHPAEEEKVQGFINKDINELQGRDILDSKKLFILKDQLNDCVKAYSNEFGADYYQIDESWYQRVANGEEVAPHAFPDDTFIGYYFPNAEEQASDIILDAPFKCPIHVPKEKSVSIYTAPNERFLLASGWVVLTPAYLTRSFTRNQKSEIDIITFNVKKIG